MKSCIPKTITEIAKDISYKFDFISSYTEDGLLQFEQWKNPLQAVGELNDYLGGRYIDIYTTKNGKVMGKITPDLIEKYNMIDLRKAKENSAYFEQINGNIWVTEEGLPIEFLNGEYHEPVDPFAEAVEEEFDTSEFIDKETQDKILGSFNTMLQYLQGRIGELNKQLKVIEQRIKYEKRKNNTDEVERLYQKIADIKFLLDKFKTIYRGIEKYRKNTAEFGMHNIFKIVSTIARKELEYADKLIDSGLAEALNEAKDIINYYIKLGEIKIGQEHPLLHKDVIDKMAEATSESEIYEYRKQLNNIGKLALDLLNKLNKNKADIIESVLSSDKGLISIISKYKNNEDDKLIDILKRPLEDISIYDMMMHDISTIVFSKDSLLAQVIKKTAMDIMEEERGAIIELLDRFSGLQEAVEKKLETHGIPGFKGHNYSIFFQKDRFGFITGKLIGPFKHEWYNTMYKNIYNTDLYKEKYAEERDKWIKENADKVDLTRVKIIREKYRNSDLFTDENGNNLFDKYSDEEAEKYEQELRKKLGDKYFEAIIDDSITAIEEFLTQVKILENNIARTYDEEKKEKAIKNYEIFIRRYNPILSSVINNFTYENEKYSVFLDGVFLMPKAEEYHEKDFVKIANDKDLYDMWTVLYEGFSYVSQSFSDATVYYAKDNIPSMKKTFLEMIIGHGRSGVLDNARLARKEMKDLFKKSIRSNEEKVIEARDKHGINKNFYDNKKEEISALSKRYYDKWDSLFNGETKYNISLSEMTAEQIAFLQDITNLSKDELYNRFTGKINIRQLLYSIARQNIVLQYSTDIPMVFRASVNLAAEYNARVRMKPLIDILMEEYKQIERKREEQGGSRFERWKEKIIGKRERTRERERAIRRMEWWYDKAVRGQFDTKQKGLFKGFKGLQYNNKRWFKGLFRFLATGKVYTSDEKRAVADFEKAMNKLYSKVINIVKKSYTNNDGEIYKVEKYNGAIERVKKYKTIKLDKNKLTEEEKKILNQWNYLAGQYAEVGANFSFSALMNSIMSFLIFKGLAYNINSAVRNGAEGWLANMIMDSTGRFWTPGNMAFAYYFITRAYKARLAPTGNEAKQWKIFDHLMIDYRILQDASNELQRNSVRSSIRNLEKTSPYYLSVSATEKRNQGAIVLSILMDIKIKDISGNEHPVFDGKEFTAFDIKNGKLVLKDNFRTSDNIETWEKQRSKEFIVFKRKVEKAIVNTHGDYTQLGGMWIKSQDWGKALMMFRTWLPQYIWQRFAIYQHDLIAETQHKGRFRSFTKTTAAFSGALAGILMGPAFSVMGATMGFIWAVNSGISTDVSIVKELVGYSKLVVKQWLNIPASFLGKKIYDIKAEEIQEYFSKDKKMSKVDAMNLAANAQEIAIMLWLILLKMLIKSIGWDDDEDKKKRNWQWRTYLVLENHITNLIETGAQYANPKIFFQNNSSITFVRWLDNVVKTVKYIQDTFEGEPYLKNGAYKGELKVVRQAKRLFIPTFADGFMFGFKSPSLQDYSKSDFFDKIFKSGK